MSTIVATAYAVNPYKGSEDGTGWNILRHLAKDHHIIAITRANNREAIERYFLEEGLIDQLEMVYYDLPQWLRFWKKGSRGALLYHYLWHLAVALFIRRQNWDYDLLHHLNFHSDWSPSFLWLTGKPYIWGPIGHHERIPKAYRQSMSRKESMLEEMRWLVKKAFWKLDPFLKISRHKAAHLLAINSSVQPKLKADKNKLSILPAVASGKGAEAPSGEYETFNILSIGRFVPLKGFDMTITAFAEFYRSLPESKRSTVRLTLIGKGPQEKYLRRLISKEGIAEATEIIPWMHRSELEAFYRQTALFFFPSHEGAGMVIPEALSYGVPVLCFDNFGPGEFVDDSCSLRIPYTNFEQSTGDFARAIHRIYSAKALHQQLKEGALKHWSKHFTWPEKARRIGEIYSGYLSKKSA